MNIFIKTRAVLGQSLIQVLIGLGVASIGTLVVMSMSDMTNRNNLNSQANLEYTQMIQGIQFKLSSNEGKKQFLDRLIAINFNPNADLELTEATLGSAAVLGTFQAQQLRYGTVTVLKILSYTGNGFSTTGAKDIPLVLLVSYQKRGLANAVGQIYSQSLFFQLGVNITQTTPLAFTLNSIGFTSTITQVAASPGPGDNFTMSASGLQQLCTELGGVFNESQTPKCKINFTFKYAVDTAGPTTWTVPAGVYSARVTVMGAGGAGGGSHGDGRGGGGGGSGSFSQSVITVIPGAVYNISVGANGLALGVNSGFSSGGSGGASSFSGNGISITANGGRGGGGGDNRNATPPPTTAQIGGTGGVVGIGDKVIAGQSGISGVARNGGSGGASWLGSEAGRGGQSVTSLVATGEVGKGEGSGGGGGAWFGVNFAGGNGSNGRVLIEF